MNRTAHISRTRYVCCWLAAIVLLSVPPYARAHGGTVPGDGQPEELDWTVTLGAVAFVTPEFDGAEDYTIRPFPNVSVEYRDLFFASIFEGVGFNLVRRVGWRAGPIAKYDFGRDESDSNALRGLGDIDGTVEVGGFLEYDFDPVGIRFELRQGLNGHDGLVGEFGIDYRGAIEVGGQPVLYSFGPRAKFGDEDYLGAFYGIDAGQSVRSGLAQYTPDWGLASYGIGLFAMMPLTEAISVTAFGGYNRLGPEAADSPLVRTRGSANQFTAGLGLSYRFGF